MKIFDMHTHCYPEKIAEAAAVNLGEFYNFTVYHGGTAENLVAASKESGVSGVNLLSAATSPSQVVKINDFLLATRDKYSSHDFTITCFASMHPDYEDKAGEISRMLSLGAKGVKIHPDIQRVDIEDPRLLPIYEQLAASKSAVYFHAGDSRFTYSLPTKIAKVKRDFPQLEVIAAHLGGYQRWDMFDEAYKNRDIWIDTSSALWAMSPDLAKELISKYDSERIFFGTDYPVRTAAEEINYINELNLPAQLLERIYWKNAEAFLVNKK
ncbi:amidohydrolase [Clostridia bacterium]|nr:amidohydrolase [Clostridia bacterium]